jgi:hypothetical protein
MTLADLVGVPWKVRGRGLDGLDCVGLAVLAQKVLCGRSLSFGSAEYDEKNQYDRSSLIRDEVERLFRPADAPSSGAVALFFFESCWHVATFTDRTHFLHIFEGGTSRISRLTQAYRRHLKGVYVWSEP